MIHNIEKIYEKYSLFVFLLFFSTTAFSEDLKKINGTDWARASKKEKEFFMTGLIAGSTSQCIHIKQRYKSEIDCGNIIKFTDDAINNANIVYAKKENRVIEINNIVSYSYALTLGIFSRKYFDETIVNEVKTYPERKKMLEDEIKRLKR